MSTCEKLSDEFYRYRSALEPLAYLGEHSFVVQGGNYHNRRPIPFMKIWEREGSRRHVIRDFKIFAVNLIHKVLGKNDNSAVATALTVQDRSVLEYTAEAWLKSVGITTL